MLLALNEFISYFGSDLKSQPPNKLQSADDILDMNEVLNTYKEQVVCNIANPFPREDLGPVLKVSDIKIHALNRKSFRPFTMRLDKHLLLIHYLLILY